MMITNKLIKLLLILFLVVYFLFLVITRAPAEMAASLIHKSVPQLWLTGVEGSAWSGTAKGAQLDLPGSSLPLGQLTWKLSGLSLLLLSPCVELETRDGAVLISGEACHSITGTLSLDNVSIEGEVSPLTQLVNLPISGLGSVQITKAKLSNNAVKKIEARISWQNGSVNPGNGWLNVGTYGATLLENGQGGVSAEIFDVDAPLQAKLVANIKTIDLKNWQVNGVVTLGEKSPQVFKDGIQLIGEETEAGTYNIALSSD